MFALLYAVIDQQLLKRGVLGRDVVRCLLTWADGLDHASDV